MAAIVAWIISAGGIFTIFIFLTVAVFLIIRTHILFKKRQANNIVEDEDAITEKDGTEKIMEKCKKQVAKSMTMANNIYTNSIENFLNEDRAGLKQSLELKDNLNIKSKKQKNKVLNTISKIEEDVDSGHFYVQMVDYQREMAHSLNFLSEPLYEHINNNHKPFNAEQTKEYKELRQMIDSFFSFSLELIKDNKFGQIADLIKQRDDILVYLEKMEINQIKRIKSREVNTRNSVLFFNTITETKNMLLHAINLIKSHRDFITVTMKKKI